MAEFKRGAGSGAKAGAVYGFITVIIGIIYAYATLAPGYTIYTERALSLVFAYVIAGAIVGVIFGMIYAAAYNHLPGAKSIVKGASLGIAWWLVIGLGLMYLLGSAIDAAHIVSSLISALIWGTLVGFFWGRYNPARRTAK